MSCVLFDQSNLHFLYSRVSDFWGCLFHNFMDKTSTYLFLFSLLMQVFIVLGMYIFGSNYKRSSFLDLWQQLCWQVSPKEQSHDNINADSLRLSLLHVDLICLEPEMRHCTSYYWLRLRLRLLEAGLLNQAGKTRQQQQPQCSWYGV